MRTRYYVTRARAKVIAIEREKDNSSARRALLLKLVLVLAGVVIFVLAGTYPVGAQQAFPSILTLPDGFQPDGITIGHATDFLDGLLAGGSIHSGVTPTLIR